MTKTLTEQWREGTLEHGFYYLKSSKGFTFTDHTSVKILKDNIIKKEFHFDGDIQEVLAPVPSYWQLYGPNDGNIPVGLFTVLKIIKRDIENAQKRRSLTDLECGIKSQVVSLLKKWGIE